MSHQLSQWDKDIISDRAEEYQAFVQSLELTDGFGIYFVICSPAEAETIIKDIEKDIPQKKVTVLTLDKSIDNLFNLVEALPEKDQTGVLFIKGIEHSLIEYIKPGYGGEGDYYNLDTVPRILGHLNLQRERYRSNFNFSFVFLLPRFAYKYFVRRAPDFFDWNSGVFKFPANAEFIRQESIKVVRDPHQNYSKLPHQEIYRKLLQIQFLIDEADKNDANVLAKLLSQQGELYSALKKHTYALDSYEQSIEFNPKDESVWYSKGYELSKLKRHEEAIACLDKAILINSNEFYVWYSKGFILGELGRYEEAIACLDKAILINPNNNKAWYNKGYELGNLGRHEEAIACYDKAIIINPNDFDAWYNKAITLGELGRHEEAIACLDKAILINPNDFDVWYNKAITLAKLGRYEEAVICLDKALEKNPNNKEAKQLRKNIKTRIAAQK